MILVGRFDEFNTVALQFVKASPVGEPSDLAMPGNSLKCTKQFLPISFFTQFVQIAENNFCAKQRNFLFLSQCFCAISPLTFSGLCKTEKFSDFFGENLCNLTIVQNAGHTYVCAIDGSRVRPAAYPYSTTIVHTLLVYYVVLISL